jgi:hypothetical protein
MAFKIIALLLKAIRTENRLQLAITIQPNDSQTTTNLILTAQLVCSNIPKEKEFVKVFLIF